MFSNFHVIAKSRQVFPASLVKINIALPLLPKIIESQAGRKINQSLS
jgi:hypothetical protein